VTSMSPELLPLTQDTITSLLCSLLSIVGGNILNLVPLVGTGRRPEVELSFIGLCPFIISRLSTPEL
jgi:hypothetical protein